jgi:hypothetical protein
MSSKEIAFDEATYTEEESICEPENPALMCRGKKVKISYKFCYFTDLLK